jgi:hypothetical protein
MLSSTVSNLSESTAIPRSEYKRTSQSTDNTDSSADEDRGSLQPSSTAGLGVRRGAERRDRVTTCRRREGSRRARDAQRTRDRST